MRGRKLPHKRTHMDPLAAWLIASGITGLIATVAGFAYLLLRRKN